MTAEPAARRPDRPLLGLSMILISVALWTLHDALGKILSETFAPSKFCSCAALSP
ncbi:MAG: hypothetical protein VCD50_18145 [Alphaproteobacteria bacterium]